MEIVSRPLGVLQAHPLNARIYDAERDDSDLRRSIAERGVIIPLVIDQYNTILAGHRRWRAACALAMDSVPVIVREISDPLEAEIILIESNRQREKSASEVMREAEHMAFIFAEQARKAMFAGVTKEGAGGRGKKKNPVANLPQGSGRTRDKVAEQVGMKTGTFRSIQKVWEAANDETAPEPVRAVAQQQMAALDTKAATPHAADKAVRAAKAQANAAPEQQQADNITTFLNRNGALDRGALRVSYFEAKAKANKHLLSLNPARLPDGLDSKDIDGARDFARRLSAWATAFEDALPRGLRVLRAE